LLGKHQIAINALYVVVILLGGILAGKPAAYVTAFLSLLGCIAVENSFGYSPPDQFLSQGSQLIIYLIAAYLGGALGEALLAHVGESYQKNTDLTLLLEASLIVASSLDFEKTLPELTQKILYGLPASFVRIDLIEGEKAICFGSAAQRTALDHPDEIARQIVIKDSPLFSRLIEKPQVTLLSSEKLQSGRERLSFYEIFPSEIKNCCVIPLLAKQNVCGILSVGEARDLARELFDANKLEFLGTLANQLGVVIDNVRLSQAEKQKAKRLEVLYEIANVFNTTIELNDLLEKLHGLLMQVLPADTYYVGFLDKEKQVVDISLLIDDGKRFEAQKVGVNEGLIGYVVRTQQPLFIRSLEEEWEKLPVKPLQLGQSKMSASWMGVPLGKDEHLNGILAVASYQPNAFSDEDFSLLISVAQQAKLAFDNARHHAQVEEQARRDSLTGALNHRIFLEKLDAMVKLARIENQPLSLIMLDIDFFKEYNDSYGHVLGDEVLRLAVNTIQKNIHVSDIVGRWGGEEFGVILANTSLEDACKVSERIRKTLANLSIQENEQTIPAPTVSQGIACYPIQAQSPEELVVKADQALYFAKSGGRDQICVWGEEISCR
ncbi:MAG: diguanylate cyclase, partial [Anaerolineales bacterium]